METIYKYNLEITDVQTISLPHYAKILTAQMQNGSLQLWCLINTENIEHGLMKDIQFYIVGTGNPMPEVLGLQYVSTFQAMNGNFVGHVFLKSE